MRCRYVSIFRTHFCIKQARLKVHKLTRNIFPYIRSYAKYGKHSPTWAVSRHFYSSEKVYTTSGSRILQEDNLTAANRITTANPSTSLDQYSSGRQKASRRHAYTRKARRQKSAGAQVLQSSDIASSILIPSVTSTPQLRLQSCARKDSSQRCAANSTPAVLVPTVSSTKGLARPLIHPTHSSPHDWCLAKHAAL